MSIIEDLWNGNISVSELPKYKTKEYDAARKRLLASEERLLALLSDEGRKIYDELTSNELELTCVHNRTAFVSGFRLGVQMLLDAMRPGCGS